MTSVGHGTPQVMVILTAIAAVGVPLAGVDIALTGAGRSLRVPVGIDERTHGLLSGQLLLDGLPTCSEHAANVTVKSFQVALERTSMFMSMTSLNDVAPVTLRNLHRRYGTIPNKVCGDS